ncbi:helix-turn-helix domain-containing protein [Aureimonas ureilytica]|uniref:helix-turn-helix domain-containing protein n=1 Tax=Aureimonas ureilytica TaxID=401562 RepID=UPI001FCD8FC2|nr:helix-turn-helix domain-containing protein [Aureimonas ureilytica]
MDTSRLRRNDDTLPVLDGDPFSHPHFACGFVSARNISSERCDAIPAVYEVGNGIGRGIGRSVHAHPVPFVRLASKANRTLWTAAIVHNARMARDTTQKDRLQSAREAKGYSSPTEAALAMKVNKNTYISHENGNRPISKKAAADYAEKLGVSAGWLLYGEHSDSQASEISAPEPPASYKELTDRERKIVNDLISSLLAARPEETPEGR